MPAPLLPLLALTDTDAAVLVAAIASLAGANVWLLKTVITKLTDSIDRLIAQVGEVHTELRLGREEANTLMHTVLGRRADNPGESRIPEPPSVRKSR